RSSTQNSLTRQRYVRPVSSSTLRKASAIEVAIRVPHSHATTALIHCNECSRSEEAECRNPGSRTFPLRIIDLHGRRQHLGNALVTRLQVGPRGVFQPRLPIAEGGFNSPIDVAQV